MIAKLLDGVRATSPDAARRSSAFIDVVRAMTAEKLRGIAGRWAMMTLAEEARYNEALMTIEELIARGDAPSVLASGLAQAARAQAFYAIPIEERNAFDEQLGPDYIDAIEPDAEQTRSGYEAPAIEREGIAIAVNAWSTVSPDQRFLVYAAAASCAGWAAAALVIGDAARPITLTSIYFPFAADLPLRNL